LGLDTAVAHSNARRLTDSGDDSFQLAHHQPVSRQRFSAARLLKSPEPQGRPGASLKAGPDGLEEQKTMVSNFPHLIASADESSSSEEARRAEGFGGRMLGRVRQAFCGLHGHDTLLQFEEDRMFLKCVSCGHESPGWALNETPPTVRVQADEPRRTLVRPQLIGERRIA
jgi:hypothetical protein